MSLNIERVVVRLDKVNTTIASNYTATCKEYAEDAADSAASSLSYSGAAQSYASQAGEAYSQTILAAQVNLDAVETVNAAVIDATASALAASSSSDTAVDAANTATTKAVEAATYASTISASVSTCATSANTCSTKAGEALASANAAAISEANAASSASSIAPHIANKSNPHEVTAAQVGATPIAHATDTANPHSVTKAQVGLTNVTDDAQVKRSEIGAVSGVASLGADGKVPSGQLPAASVDTCSTQITNAGFGVWSNGTLESAVSSIDLLGGTGEFEVAGDVALWTTGGGATFIRDTANAVNGSGCGKLSNDASNNAGYASRQFSTVTGNVYKAVCYAKATGTNNAYLKVGTSSGGSEIASVYTPYAQINTVVKHELVFEATGTTTFLTVANQPSVPNGIGYFDSITLYDMGANLVTNGTFNTNTTGWTAGNGTFTPVAGGINGTCGQLTNGTGTTCQVSKEVSAFTIGGLHRLTFWQKSTTDNTYLKIGTTPGSNDVYQGSLMGGGSWVFYSVLFEASSTSIWLTFYNGTTATGLYSAIDSITLTEVTVGCVDYNTKSLDLFTKDFAAQCWRDQATVKEGSFYSLRVYNGAVYWSDGNRAANKEFYFKYSGRAVALGMWVLCSTANKARIGISTSGGTQYSSYHSGSGAWEWLEITSTPTAGITSFSIVLDSGTSTAANFSQPQLMFGASVGTGNFVPIPGEVINFDSPVVSAFFNASPRTLSTTPTSEFFTNVDTLGKIGSQKKRIYCQFKTQDAASASAIGVYFKYGGVSSSPNGVTNYASVSMFGVCACKSNGNVDWSCVSSGTNTLYETIYYLGVQL